MGTLQKFIEIAATLEGSDKALVEDALEEMMLWLEGKPGLSPEQAIENARRMANPNPTYADPADINAIFGRALPH